MKMSLVYVLFKDSVTGRDDEGKGQRSARVLLSDTKKWSQRRSMTARETKNEAEGEIGFRRVKMEWNGDKGWRQEWQSIPKVSERESSPRTQSERERAGNRTGLSNSDAAHREASNGQRERSLHAASDLRNPRVRPWQVTSLSRGPLKL